MGKYHEICETCEDETITHGWVPDKCPFCKINQLERELAEADQKWERRLIAALGGHADSKLWGDDGLIAATWRCVEGYEKMEKDLSEARKQRDTLAEACRNLMKVVGAPDTNEWQEIEECDAAYLAGKLAINTLQGGEQ
jgi:hypothetical protein